MRIAPYLLFGLLALVACGETGRGVETAQACQQIEHIGSPYTVCSYTRSETDIRLFHSDADGTPYLQFDALVEDLKAQDKTLVFAMNGGMYHEDRSPVGYYRDGSGDQASVNTNVGPGNFHMLPNGVFWLTSDAAGVTESTAYIEADIDTLFATQSGPMLVIEGALHPSFNPDGTSRKRRNGVGVSADGTQVHFAISDTVVSFHDFATLFRDALDAENALFLDGQVSRLYAPDLQRNEAGVDMGPIVGVVE
ncbi:MAG: phosphodiester glycosidase family protein [Pseudomonadota bacterium]